MILLHTEKTNTEVTHTLSLEAWAPLTHAHTMTCQAFTPALFWLNTPYMNIVLALTHTYTHSLTLSHTLTHSHTHVYTRIHTHTHTHVLFPLLHDPSAV